MNITYTFPLDCPIADLRGVTVSGGKIGNHLIAGKLVEVVSFETKVNGKPVAAKVAGKPELEAAVAAVKADAAKAKANARAELEAAVPGLIAYEQASIRYSRAAAAYDSASEHGYPAKEAAAAEAADKALQEVFAQYPATALWAKIIKYTQASNYSKSSAGDVARKSVEAGESIEAVVKKMEADWLGAAQRAVDNS